MIAFVLWALVVGGILLWVLLFAGLVLLTWLDRRRCR